MRRRATLLWVLFGIGMFLLLALCIAGAWLILGPYGPPLPWRQSPQATTPAPTTAGATAGPITGRPTPKATLGTGQPSPQATGTPPPTVESPPSLSPYPGATLPPATLPPATLPPATLPPATLPPATPAGPAGSDGTETARRLAAAVLTPRDIVALTSRLLHDGAALPRTVTPDPQPYTVGREDRFWLSDQNVHREITATLRYITDHLYMYVESDIDVDEPSLEEAARTFEDEIYPTTRAAFGSEWTPGVDGDPHIVILHARFEDAAGYFFSLNEVPRQVNPYSNQHEMFCMNTDAMDIGDIFYLSTLAHEFQHMIHWYRDPSGASWVDEGMAQMSEQINGFDANTWGWTFLSDPDVQLTTWAGESEESYAHYGASYLWFRYFTDRLGGTEVLSSLLDPQTDEITAIERALESAGYTPVVTAPRLFDAFFADWAAANYINDRRVGDGRYAYARGIDLDTLWPTESVYTLPWDTTATVFPYATDYIAVEAFDEGTLSIAFDGGETLPLVNTAPHSGGHFWYSNRGDQSDMTLTRAFDLRGASQATLRYWLWYDIELDWDYAYVEVSTDAGNSWTILPTRHTTDTNPNGNSFGPGYTGKSGGGNTPRWIQEELDLGTYAGREVLVRFETVSDDAYNAPGLALDDVEIPEIGFSDDMENDQGWQASGFVWVDNVVPLNFLVQLVTETPDGALAVQPLPLDAGQRGEISLPGYGRSIYRATLLVSAVAPVTTEPASYQVQISLK